MFKYVVRILVSLKKRIGLRFNPRCGIQGCFRLSLASDYDLPHALAETRFCQLQTASVNV